MVYSQLSRREFLRLAAKGTGAVILSQLPGESIVKHHSIREEYGIETEDLMPMMNQKSFTIVVNGTPREINTGRFLSDLLEMDAVKVMGVVDYNYLANTGRSRVLAKMDDRLTRARSFDDRERVYGANGVVRGVLSPIHNMTSGSKIPEFECRVIDADASISWRHVGSNRAYDNLAKKDFGDYGVVMDLADRVFPREIRRRRAKRGIDVFVDRKEAFILETMVNRVLQKPYSLRCCTIIK